MELPLKTRNEIEDFVVKNNLDSKKAEAVFTAAREIYRSALYEAGEPIGVITAQSLSEPATQMSIDAKEKVIVKHNGSIAIQEIGAFTDRLLESQGVAAEDGWEIADLSTMDVTVPSITADEKIVWRKVLACSRHRAPEHLLRLQTLSGREITATGSHSFVVRRGNRIMAVSADQLAAGERLPALRLLPEHCLESLPLPPLLGGIHARAKRPLPQNLPLDFTTGWLFGAYLSEGNSTPNFVNISNMRSFGGSFSQLKPNESFLGKIRGFAAAYNLTTNEYDNDRGFAHGHDLRINSTSLSVLLSRTCGSGSRNKKLPDFAYSAQEPFVSGLLQSYFDGDGNVSVTRGVIRASSNSQPLRDGIALLLCRFGIFCTKGQQGKQYTLTIPATYAARFREKVGFATTEKAARLDSLCLATPVQDFIDTIGGFDDLFVRTARKLGYPTRYVNSCTKRQKIGRGALLRLIARFQHLAQEKNIDINEELRLMKIMHASDVVWDEIIRIETVKPSSPYVYDFTVEDTQTFTTFSGIVTHNTMRTYHFAGTAGIQVTLGLPRISEIFDARKEPRTPAMTVYIKSEFQNMDSIKKIAENIKEIKMKDFITSVVIDLTDQWIKFAVDQQKLAASGIDFQKIPKNIKIRNCDLTIDGTSLILKQKKEDLRNLHKMKYTFLESHVKGIKGISQVVVSKEGEEWVISTLGSNLKKVFDVEGVDHTRTVTNNIFEINDVLGIEAARNAIIQQTKYTLDEQGLGVDSRYIMLLADLMTVTGEIQAIGRYGISGTKSSVLVRASFEETKKHFTAAAIRGDRDELTGTIENIMMNQVAPIGTGDYELIGTLPKKKE